MRSISLNFQNNFESKRRICSISYGNTTDHNDILYKLYLNKPTRYCIILYRAFWSKNILVSLLVAHAGPFAVWWADVANHGYHVSAYWPWCERYLHNNMCAKNGLNLNISRRVQPIWIYAVNIWLRSRSKYYCRSEKIKCNNIFVMVITIQLTNNFPRTYFVMLALLLLLFAYGSR
jgi:hypothetical protein